MSRSRPSNWAAAVPFTAVCPHCRDAKFQVPWKKVDRPHTCPKCGQEFHLLPDDTPHGLLVRAGQSVTAVARQTAPAAPPSPPAAEPTAAVPSSSTHDLRDHADAPTVMALLGVALFGLAVVASQFPYGRLVAAGLAAVGAVLAGLSLLGLDGWRRVGWAGLGLNALTLLLVLALPGWLGLTGWVPVPEPGDGPKPVTAVGRNDGLARSADWVDANFAVWEQGDVRVAVIGASFVPPDPNPAVKSATPGRKDWVVKVGVKLTNVGVARGIEFAGWPPAGPGAPFLTTVGGKTLVLRPPAAPPEKATIYPGKSAECWLVFAPPAAPDELRLELPPAAFGGPDSVRFRLPRGMVFGR